MNTGKLASNFIWRMLERFGAQGVTFFVSILLARLLEPDVYGTVALVTVFISVLQVFVDSGLGSALIQKKDADALDFSSVFFFNVAVCLILYLLLFAVSQPIASFYKNPDLVPVIRVLGITLVISGVKNIQQAYVSRELIFKKFFFSTLIGTIGAAILGIGLAYAGYGVWALVIQMVFNTLLDTVVLWITVPWRPQAVFSWKRLSGLLKYGWKLLVSALIDTGYEKLRELLIGKLYSTSDLAFYNKGNQLPSVLAINVSTSVDSVLFPAMAVNQDHLEQVRAMTRKAMKLSTYCIMPMMFGIVGCAESIVRVLLTEKWLLCVPYLRIFAVSYSIYSVHSANLNAMKAVGRSDLFLKLEIMKKAAGLIILLCSLRFGPLVMAYTSLLTNVVSFVINSFPNKKLLQYGFWEQLKDIIPGMLLSGSMCAGVFLLAKTSLSGVFLLFIQIAAGILLYLAGSIAFRIDSFYYVKDFIFKYRKG